MKEPSITNAILILLGFRTMKIKAITFNDDLMDTTSIILLKNKFYTEIHSVSFKPYLWFYCETVQPICPT